MSIPHVDVKAQYAPLIPELKDAFARTLDSARFIFGPEVADFEREAAELLGVQETVSCANGTDALVLVMDAMEIGPGDEVICPAFTFYATAEAMAPRREAAARYTELLAGLVETPVDDDGHVYHMYCVRSPERDRIAAALQAADIGVAVYYQPPLHLQPALRYLGHSRGDFPETEKASLENLCLPLWAGITEEQQSEVVSVLKRALDLVRT